MGNCSTCSVEQTSTNTYLHSNGKFRQQCKQCILTRRKPVSKEITQRSSKKYRLANSELQRQRNKVWRKSNLEYDAFRSATYRARKLNQTPSWADLELIELIYEMCPKGYHVDHIVPLKGKTVAGLHVEGNLQYLPAKENLAKRNIYNG